MFFRFLLLLDNAPTHPKARELNTFDPRCQVMYLPPNVTSLVFDCMKILKEAWDTLLPTTLGNAWKKVLLDLKKNSVNIPSSKNKILKLLNLISGGGQCSSNDVDKWFGEDENLQSCKLLSDEVILNSCAGLKPPLPEDTEDEPENEDDECDENVTDAPESQTVFLAYGAARILLDWLNKHSKLSNEDVSVVSKIRDFAIDKMLDVPNL